jgi:hypothetical protein
MNSYSVTNKEYKELLEEEKQRDRTPNTKGGEQIQKVIANNFFNE